MNSKERLNKFMAGEQVDRLPNLTIIGAVGTQYTKISLEDFCKDYSKMVESAVIAALDLELDFIQIGSDLCREAEAFGATVKYYPNQLPQVVKPAIRDIHEIGKLKPLKISEHKRLSDVIEAAGKANTMQSERHPMVALPGPFTVAGNILGMETLMTATIDETSAVEELLEITAETSLSFIRALSDIGISYVYLPDPMVSLIGPAFYRDVIMNYHKKLFGELKSRNMHTRLHICGRTEHLIPYTSLCGAEILDVDHVTDLAGILPIAGNRCILNGNIDPVKDVYRATPEHTKAAILSCAKAADGYRMLFMPGCELPYDTPLENIRAIHDALIELSSS